MWLSIEMHYTFTTIHTCGALSMENGAAPVRSAVCPIERIALSTPGLTWEPAAPIDSDWAEKEGGCAGDWEGSWDMCSSGQRCLCKDQSRKKKTKSVVVSNQWCIQQNSQWLMEAACKTPGPKMRWLQQQSELEALDEWMDDVNSTVMVISLCTMYVQSGNWALRLCMATNQMWSWTGSVEYLQRNSNTMDNTLNLYIVAMFSIMAGAVQEFNPCPGR